MNSLKIAILNVQGINKDEKFEDVIHWHLQERNDITILTETKLPTKIAEYKLKNLQKNLNNIKNPKKRKITAFWSHDELNPKGNGIGILLNHDMIGKHVTKHKYYKGRSIEITATFKGKRRLRIIGIYSPAGKDEENRRRKNELVNRIHNATNTTDWTIIGGDFNEDESAHTHAKIIQTLKERNLWDTSEAMEKREHTWSNTQGITRQLDYIFIIPELATQRTSSTTRTAPDIATDHKIYQVIINTDLTISNRTHQRRGRGNRPNVQDIIDTKKTSKADWEKFQEEIIQTMNADPYQTFDDIDEEWEDIKEIIIKAAKKTVKWRKTNHRNKSSWTKTETLIYKGRKYMDKLREMSAEQTITPEMQETLNKLHNRFPRVEWPITETNDPTGTYMKMAETWQGVKKALYTKKDQETHRRIVEAIQRRDDAFKENKGKMIKSILEKKRQYIDTTNIIHDGEYLEDPELVKKAIVESAQKWTRKRKYTVRDDIWNKEYDPTNLNVAE